VRIICASSHIARSPSQKSTPSAGLAVVVVVMVMVVAMMVVVVTDRNHNLRIGRLGERCGENESEQAVQENFHI